MLYGTELSYAYTNEYEPLSGKAASPPAALPPKAPKHVDTQKPATAQVPLEGQSMDPNYLTSDQKLYLLSNELQKQREVLEKNKGNGYLDKLLAKKRDVMKLLAIAFIVVLGLSIHSVANYYVKKYFEENIVTGGKELVLRLLYPALVLLLLWHIKVFGGK